MLSGIQSKEIPLVDDYGRKISMVNDLVLTQKNGSPWNEPEILDLIHRIVREQNKQAEELGQPKLRYFTPHQIRHTYTTLAYEAGIDEKEVSARLGHASELVTRDTYTHLPGQKKKEQDVAVNKIRIS